MEWVYGILLVVLLFGVGFTGLCYSFVDEERIDGRATKWCKVGKVVCSVVFLTIALLRLFNV